MSAIAKNGIIYQGGTPVIDILNADLQALIQTGTYDPYVLYNITDVNDNENIIDDNNISTNTTWSSSKVNSNLSSLVEIRTKTVSGTTSGFGLANLGLTDYDVITKVKMTSPSANATFIKHSWNDNHDYCLVNVASTSLAKLVNTAFSGTITYLHFTPINS